MASNRGTSITHIITGLNVGGAEVMLSKLLKAVDRQRFPSKVISLTDIGEIGKRIIDAGVPVTSIGMRPGSFSFTGVQKLVEEINRQKPVIVQTWMYHADLLGGWAARKAGTDCVAWNIRNSTLDWRKSKLTTQATVRMCAVLSHSLPDRIVVCSSAAAEVHGKVGYDREKFRVIPNGFDLDVFRSNREAGLKLRKENNLDLGVPIIGLAARFDKQKDHRTFITSAGLLLNKLPGVHFLLCGDGITRENETLNRWIMETGHSENFHLLGRWKDMATFHNACDIEVSSSAYGESFSNVLGEAMACEIPCVSTRIGGAEEVLGETGNLVPPRNPLALAEKMLEFLEKPADVRMEMGKLSRQRILDFFDIHVIANSYMSFWDEMSKEL